MKLTEEIKERSLEINKNKAIYQVYGMDSEGLNFAYKTEEHDTFESALKSYNEIELEEGYRKNLKLIVEDNEGNAILEEDLLEEIEN